MPSMSMSPSQPTAGQTAKLCYDPVPLAGVDVEIIWAPSSQGTTSCTLTQDKPCCTITVPTRADAYIAEDQSGQAEDISGLVDPA